MIHSIQNPTQALDILREVAVWDGHEPCYFTTVFDLDGILDPNEVPTCLSQCETCDLTVDFKTNEDPTNECPRCGEETLEVIAIAKLIIQDAIVLWMESYERNRSL